MYFTSPISNITPALVSVAMSRSDSRDSTTSSNMECSFTSAPMTVTFSTSPMSQGLTRTATSSSLYSTRSSASSQARTDPYAGGWLTSPYRSCQMHSSFSSQGSDTSSYVSDDDLLSLEVDPLPTSMPPVETIPSLLPQTQKKEMTTEEQIAMMREMQEKQDQFTAQQRRPQPQRQVRFAQEARKPRRSSNMGPRRSNSTRRA